MCYHNTSKLSTKTYHDHANDNQIDTGVSTFNQVSLAVASIHRDASLLRPAARGGVTTPFPLKLHQLLEQIDEDGLASVISWQPHGRCFVVHNQKKFVDHVMPKYFKQTKFASFQRQLNLYGFSRLNTGKDKGGYYHEKFLRFRPLLCHGIYRSKVKGSGVRKPSKLESEPNFYFMTPMVKEQTTQQQQQALPSMTTSYQQQPQHQQIVLPSSVFSRVSPITLPSTPPPTTATTTCCSSNSLESSFTQPLQEQNMLAALQQQQQEIIELQNKIQQNKQEQQFASVAAVVSDCDENSSDEEDDDEDEFDDIMGALAEIPVDMLSEANFGKALL